MSDPDAVAKAFTDHYYATFDTNRQGLVSLYQEQSLLTFEGQKFQGPQQIMQKLTQLPFQACQHRITSLDAQPSVSGGIIVFVNGQLLPEGESNPLRFAQTFHLVPVGGSWALSNDMFRLCYG